MELNILVGCASIISILVGSYILTKIIINYKNNNHEQPPRTVEDVARDMQEAYNNKEWRKYELLCDEYDHLWK